MVCVSLMHATNLSFLCSSNAHDKLIARPYYCQLPELEAALDRWTDLADGTITPLVSAQLRDTVAHLNSVCQAPPSVLGIVQVMRKTSDGLLVATHSLYTRDAAGTTTRSANTSLAQMSISSFGFSHFTNQPSNSARNLRTSG